MLNIKKILQIGLRFRPFKFPSSSSALNSFSNIKPLNPRYLKMKETFNSKGKQSQQYKAAMVDIIKDALEKYDYAQAVNVELYHLSLIKEVEGESSMTYRDQVRDIIKFSMHRLQFEIAAKLVEELIEIQKKIPDVSPLDLIANTFVQGSVYSQLGRLEDSKDCLNRCIQSKYVKEAPEVYFKVYSELAKVHVKSGEDQQAYKVLSQCEIFLTKREIDPKGPQMYMIMHLQDIFSLAQVASSLKNKDLALKYMEMYREKIDKVSNQNDAFYVEYLERLSKIHFTLQEFEKAVELLRSCASKSEQLGKSDPNMLQNSKNISEIIESIEENYLKKK